MNLMILILNTTATIFLPHFDSDNSDYDSISPWIIRFVFNKEDMLDKGIIMEDVYLSIMAYDNTRIKQKISLSYLNNFDIFIIYSFDKLCKRYCKK